MRKVVGHHSCSEVFKVRPKSIKCAYLKKDYLNSDVLKEFFNQIKKYHIPLKLVSIQELDRVCDGHQGIALDVSESPDLNINNLKKKTHSLILALDGVEDPQNLGNVLRTAWLLGADAIMITENRSVGLTPSVCKIASGAAEHIPVLSYNQLIQGFDEFKEMGYWVYGLSEKASQRLFDCKLSEKTILVGGNEMKGLKPQTLKSCDELVTIPQIIQSESLNVATSMALGAYEYLSQTCTK